MVLNSRFHDAEKHTTVVLCCIPVASTMSAVAPSGKLQRVDVLFRAGFGCLSQLTHTWVHV